MVTCVQLKQLCMQIQSQFTRILEHILKVIFFIKRMLFLKLSNISYSSFNLKTSFYIKIFEKLLQTVGLQQNKIYLLIYKQKKWPMTPAHQPLFAGTVNRINQIKNFNGIDFSTRFNVGLH